MRLLTNLRRLARDDAGVSMIEMGFVMPFLGVLMMGCIDLGMGLSERYELQQAAHRTIELANVRTLTADKDANEIDFSFLKSEAATAAGVPPSQVTLTRWVECNGTVKPAYDMVCQPTEKVARYIQLEILKEYTPMFGLARIYPITNPNGSVQMTVEAAVRIQ